MPHIGQKFGKAAVASATAVGALAAALLAPDRAPAADPPSGQDEAKVITVEKVTTPAQGKAVIMEKAEVIPPGAVNGLGVNVEQAAQTMVLRLGLILRTELRYLTLSARPTLEQRRGIALEAGRALQEHARAQAGANLGNGGVVAQKMVVEVQAGAPKPVMVQRAVAANARTDARRLIHDAVEAAARARLAPEQFARYQEELDRKVRERREVVLVNIVAKLDGLLALGQDQRDKLQEALRTHWDDRNFPTVETIAMYEQYYPTIQDVLILPILSDGQQKIWRNAQKINFASIRVNQQANANQFLGPDDLDHDADLKAALAPGVAP